MLICLCLFDKNICQEEEIQKIPCPWSVFPFLVAWIKRRPCYENAPKKKKKLWLDKAKSSFLADLVKIIYGIYEWAEFN